MRTAITQKELERVRDRIVGFLSDEDANKSSDVPICSKQEKPFGFICNRRVSHGGVHIATAGRSWCAQWLGDFVKYNPAFPHLIEEASRRNNKEVGT